MIHSVDSGLPKVSVGFPVRNGGNTLAAALRSAQTQTETQIEIIVSDNGSDDDTRKLVEAASRHDPRIRYFRQERALRAYDNFRFVLDKARGKYFMWAAHDDTRDNDFIERLVEALEANPEAVLAFGDLNIVTPENPAGKSLAFPFENAGRNLLVRLARQSRMQCFHIYGVWRTAALRRVPYAYCVWWPDLPMMLAAAVLGNFVHVPGTRFNYLEVPKSNPSRAANQDYSKRFSLVVEVPALIAATYRACSRVGGVMIGVYCAGLVTGKQVINLPGFLYRRLKGRLEVSRA